MLYLASASPRRAQLLKEAGIPFKILKSSYPEKPFPRMTPSTLVKKHALGKALAVCQRVQEGEILAADTLVYFKGKMIGKPKNFHKSFETLHLLQGKWHTVYTGVAYFRIKKSRIVRRLVFVEKTRVLLEKMDTRQIQSYFRRVNPLDKAGSYAIQAKGKTIVKAIKGSLSNAVGLPIERLGFLC